MNATLQPEESPDLETKPRVERTWCKLVQINPTAAIHDSRNSSAPSFCLPIVSIIIFKRRRLALHMIVLLCSSGNIRAAWFPRREGGRRIMQDVCGRVGKWNFCCLLQHPSAGQKWWFELMYEKYGLCASAVKCGRWDGNKFTLYRSRPLTDAIRNALTNGWNWVVS